MRDKRAGAAGGFDAIEARNALVAEGFRHLPDDIELWRFREVLTKLGTELSLSAGAALYALDLLGLLTEADWRGDGRAVTFHSIRTYARKVGKSERTICEYERQLIAAGLVHRTLKHARRHGGQGCETRRTGLDWRAFGAMMPVLLERLDARKVTERRRLDIEARIRETRFVVAGLIDSMEEGRAAPLRIALAEIGVMRLRGTIPLADLERRFAALLAFRSTIAPLIDPVDNPVICSQGADRSEETGSLIYITATSQSPEEICSEVQEEAIEKYTISIMEEGSETERGIVETNSVSPNPAWRKETGAEKKRSVDTLPLSEIWKAAPQSWKAMLSPEVPLSWPVLVEVANHMAPCLGVHPSAWGKALHRLGPVPAALALMVLDRNRRHPKHPVYSVGGALVGMVRRAGEGTLDLSASIHGIMGRTEGAAEYAAERP